METAYFDAHCDTLTAWDGRYNRIRLNIENEGFAARGQIFAVCADENPRVSGLLGACVSRLRGMNNTVICGCAEDLLRAEREKKTAAFLSIEGAEVIKCNLDELDRVYGYGVRFIGLTWNIENGLSGTCVQKKRLGLTQKGRAFAQKALETGMTLDISHISDAAARELIALAPGRVMASHSNSRSVCDNPRNLTDEIFISLAKSGGVCGINLYPPFLTNSETAGITDVLRHIEHFASLFPGALRHIALGCDLDGCGILPKGIDVSADIGKIYEALLSANYSESDAKGIFYGNLREFILKALRINGETV